MTEVHVTEVPVAIAKDEDGNPVGTSIGGQRYASLSWSRGEGPPYSAGIYLWLTDDLRVLYVGKATSNRTSHLYRRITAYKRASTGKTQITSLRINAEILALGEQGRSIRLICISTPSADPQDLTKLERRLIRQARPPWNREGNPLPRRVDEAVLISDVLPIDPLSVVPSTISIDL